MNYSLKLYISDVEYDTIAVSTLNNILEYRKDKGFEGVLGYSLQLLVSGFDVEKYSYLFTNEYEKKILVMYDENIEEESEEVFELDISEYTIVRIVYNPSRNNIDIDNNIIIEFER